MGSFQPDHPLSEAALQDICAVLARKTGNDFSRYKPATLQRRIQRRMRVTGVHSLPDYLDYLEQAPEETALLLKDLLISVTEFFRDPEAFEGLVAHLSPEGLAGGEGPVRVWVPGCASGEEAYSIAILLSEHLAAMGSGRRVQIFATDIDAAALIQARAGRYPEEALRNVSPERRRRFFTPDGAFHQVDQGLRDMCMFSVQNILQDPPFASLHLISCRNVFIYLQPGLQARLIPWFHFALKPGGLLFLGSAEGLASRTELFDPLDQGSRVFRRKEAHPRPRLEFPVGGRQPLRAPAQTGGASLGGASGLFERMLLEEYVPASAIVNEQGDVLFCAGRIGRFLNPGLGEPNHNLLQSTSGELRRQLRRLLAKAAGERGGPGQSIVLGAAGLGEGTLRLTVRPMPGLDRDSGLFALVIQDQAAPDPVPDPSPLEEKDHALLDQMDRELRSARLELQTTVEELESTNEELRAANEELQSSNEALQASQQELQSANEELTTINNELNQKVHLVEASENRFRNLFEHMVNGFAHCRMRFDGDRPSDFIYLSVNDAFRTQTGLADAAGRWVSELIPGIREADPGLFEIYGRVARSGLPERFETYVEALHDWYDISVYGPGGDEFVAVFEVVTARKEAEAALRESEERLNLAMEKSHTGGWEFDLGRREAFRTPEHARIFGHAPGDAAWSFERFIGHIVPEERDKVSHQLKEAIALKRDWSIECRIQRADGKLRWIRVAGGPLGGEHRPDRMAGIVQDITDQKHAELELRSLADQINHLQRLESIGRLAGGVSHDINNVLAAIMAVGSTLQMRHAQDPAIAKDAETLLSAATRGRDLVKGLRDFSRKELESAADLDLNQLARQEAELLDHTTLKKVIVDLDLEPGLPMLHGEASAISNALMNLCLNACDAMPRGGRLSLTTRSLGRGFVELAVQDQGEGMPPEILAKAMEPFFTTKPAGKGTGLGLSQVYGTMKAHGGTLDLRSTPGLGTRVALVFPCAGAVRGAANTGADAAAPAGRALEILLVDDEELVRRAVAPLFEVLGHRVQTASGGLEALRRLEAGMEPDLVILDLNMPGLDGSETFRRMRAIRPDLPVVFATGYVDERIPSILGRFTKVRILKKPFSTAEIQEVLHGWF